MNVVMREECNTYAPNVALSAIAPDTMVVAVAAKAHWNSHKAYRSALKSPVSVPYSFSPLRANPVVPMKPPESSPKARPFPKIHHASAPIAESPMFLIEKGEAKQNKKKREIKEKKEKKKPSF